MTSEIISATPDCEIVTSRIVSASREIAYEAWSDPDHLKIWWGPAGFTNTFNEFDFRPGGKWSFIMHGPDKGNYANECEFIKIERPSLIAWKRFSKPLFQVVVTFEEISTNKTKTIFKQIFDTAEECSKIKVLAVDKNEENFDRLEAKLVKMNV
ncbi:MAG: SRPBCC family protein [Bacteroidetes bacterium]|nr:SRPBCC family protein [Bacteroidota bacterium]